MRKFVAPLLSTLIAFAFVTSAKAHNAPAILTLGGNDARTSHSDGATCTLQNGVNLCGAVKKASTDEELQLEGSDQANRNAGQKQIIVVTRKTIVETKAREFRRLRTHRVFGSDPYPSRRFTHGFFADRVAAGH